jgi:hypothetical protein
MKRSVIRGMILEATYTAWEKHTNCWLERLWQAPDRDKDLFVFVIDELESEGLIRHHAQWDYRATADGVVYAEEQHIIPRERSRPHRHARKEMLKALATLHQDQGPKATIYFKELCERAGIDEDLFHVNETVLRGLGLIESRSVGHFRITPEGLRRVN